jgi:hypothetical protein
MHDGFIISFESDTDCKQAVRSHTMTIAPAFPEGLKNGIFFAIHHQPFTGNRYFSFITESIDSDKDMINVIDC